MRLPLGLDLKSVVVTVAVIYFVLPFVLRLWASKTAAKK
jgi:hypothetical protein